MLIKYHNLLEKYLNGGVVGALCLICGNITIDDLVIHDGRVRMAYWVEMVSIALLGFPWQKDVKISAVAGPIIRFNPWRRCMALMFPM